MNKLLIFIVVILVAAAIVQYMPAFPMPNLFVLFILALITYLILYIRGRKYLETFEGGKRFRGDGSPATEPPPKNTLPEIAYKPYANMPIDDLFEFDDANVFQNRGSKVASKKQISDAMTRYPMDWPSRGPDSQVFQEEQAQFEKEVKNTKERFKGEPNFYREVDGRNMELPDQYKIDDEEKKILQTYKPESSKGLLEYSVDDVKGLLHKMYDKKGLIPIIEKSRQGENVWEIVEVKEKNPKIVWEDDVEATQQRAAMEKRGEEVIQVPYTASDIRAGLDPFFQPRNSVRDSKFDYTQWTPGLERMFAPTYPLKSWY
jgi:hypothetical protein